MKHFNLQLFAEPGAANSSTGDSAPAQTAAPAGNGDGSQNPGLQIDPAEVERIAAKKAEQAQRAALRSYYQQNGMTETEAEEAIKAYKESKAAQIEKDKGNLAKLQQRLEAMEKGQSAAMAAANSRLVNAEARIQANSLGIKPERLDYAIRLADLSKVTVDESGTVDQAAVKTAIDQVLKDLPELKATAETAPGFKLGADGSKNASENDDALRRAMGLPPKK